MTKAAAGDIIGRDTLSQKVYAVLRERILTGQLKQGQRIGELAVSKELGVSATPVREALRLLKGDSLIEYEGRRGARVICPSIPEIRQCYDVRLVLETLALKEADANFTDADRDQFVALAEKTCVAASPQVMFMRDRDFHAFFIEKAANTWVSTFYRAIVDFLLVVRLPSSRKQRFADAGAEHLVIANAIRDRDLETALATLEKQIKRSRDWSIEARTGAAGAERDSLGKMAK